MEEVVHLALTRKLPFRSTLRHFVKEHTTGSAGAVITLSKSL